MFFIYSFIHPFIFFRSKVRLSLKPLTVLGLGLLERPWAKKAKEKRTLKAIKEQRHLN